MFLRVRNMQFSYSLLTYYTSDLFTCRHVNACCAKPVINFQLYLTYNLISAPVIHLGASSDNLLSVILWEVTGQSKSPKFFFFFWSLPDVFSLSIPRVSSVKTQLIYCQLKWRHFSTQGVIIRPITEPCMRYIKWKCTFLGYQNVYSSKRTWI